MTAEVAVMNKLAVALAADSAVTVERGGKVFNTANKLFMLSKHEPVGIMVYNNAELLGLPWETIIKVFREELGSRSYPTLEEYADEFVRFIGESSTLFPGDVQQDCFAGIVTAYLMTLRDSIDSRVKAVIDESGYITRRQVSAIRRQVLDDGIRQLSKSTSLSSVSEQQAVSLVTRRDSLIQRMAKQVFEKHPLTEANLRQVKQICVLMCQKELPFPTYSGIVIAGFGTDDVFPGIVTFVIDGIIDGIARCSAYHVSRIDRDNGAQVSAFGQKDMASTFMEGIDPRLKEEIQEWLTRVLRAYPKVVMERLKTALGERDSRELLQKLLRFADECVERFAHELDHYSQQQHWAPIMKAVGALPKDELASMAESLVNLTSFKRRVSMDQETVGGAIDVAVISKGDGFIWVKRKHYFKPELNHAFFANYFKEKRSGANE